ncbi:WD40/YVTN repeat-like-containing domain containing protein [Balamuthia mandrillaris]
MSSFSVAQWAHMTELWLKAKQDMEEATGRPEIMYATSSCPSEPMGVAGSFPPHNFFLSDEEEGASSSPYSSCTSSFSAAFYHDDEDCDADWVLRFSNQLPEEDYTFGSSSCPSPMVTMAADLLLPPPPPNLPPQSIAYQPHDQTPSNNNEETLLHIQPCNGFQDIEVVMTPTHRVEGKEEEEKGKEEDDEEEEEEEEVEEKQGKHGIEEEEKKKSEEVERTGETESYNQSNRKPTSSSTTMDNASLSWRDAVMTLQATKAEGGVRGAKWWWYLQGQMDQVMPSSSATSSASSCSSAPTTPSTAKRAAAGGKTGATSRVGRRSGAPIASTEGTTVAPTTRKRPVTPPPTRKLPPRSKLRGVIEWLQQEQQQQQVQACTGTDVTAAKEKRASRRVG